MFKMIAWRSLGHIASVMLVVQLCDNAITDSPSRKFSAASDSKRMQMKRPQIVHQHCSFHPFILNRLLLQPQCRT